MDTCPHHTLWQIKGSEHARTQHIGVPFYKTFGGNALEFDWGADMPGDVLTL